MDIKYRKQRQFRLMYVEILQFSNYRRKSRVKAHLMWKHPDTVVWPIYAIDLLRHFDRNSDTNE